MSAPAVPTSASVAPTTKVDSTAEAPHGESVSAIGHEGAGPEEALVHTGAFNSIDLTLRMQYIALASFRWSTDQNAGTLLWSSTIVPTSSHQYIRHLKKMYNTWVGGFNYNFKVCGTGFHAGAIAIVRLPPNISPSSVTSPSDFTVFEYVVLDPKLMEIDSKHIIDQRRLMYHYTNKDLEISNPDALGGHIACYVLVPLATSSTGNQSISIQVFTKPAHDFNFFQLKPIEEEGAEPEPDNPDQIVNSLTANEFTKNGTSLFSDQITSFRVQPMSQVKPPNITTVGTYGFDGKLRGPDVPGELPVPLSGYSKAKWIATASKSKLQIEKLSSLPIASSIDIQIVAGSNNLDPFVLKGTLTMSGPGEFQTAYEYEGDAYCYYNIKSYTEVGPADFRKNADESFFNFLNFTEGSILSGSYQPELLARLLKSGEFKDIMTPQDGIIVDMIDTDLDVPVRRLKIFYNGYITTKGDPDGITLTAKTYKFRFVQFSRISEPIPAPPENYELNQTLADFRQMTRKQRYL